MKSFIKLIISETLSIKKGLKKKMSERPTGQQQQGDKKKKETILDLAKYLDKKIRVKFSGGREASGILKGTVNVKVL